MKHAYKNMWEGLFFLLPNILRFKLGSSNNLIIKTDIDTCFTCIANCGSILYSNCLKFSLLLCESEFSIVQKLKFQFEKTCCLDWKLFCFKVSSLIKMIYN
jgi:hypothetical protein